jgi:site-specific recombinase XerC
MLRGRVFPSGWNCVWCSVIYVKGGCAPLGKGSKERLVPLGELASEWLTLSLSAARATLLNRRESDALFVTQRGAAGVLVFDQTSCFKCWSENIIVTTHFAPQFCDTLIK